MGEEGGARRYNRTAVGLKTSETAVCDGGRLERTGLSPGGGLLLLWGTQIRGSYLLSAPQSTPTRETETRL